MAAAAEEVGGVAATDGARPVGLKKIEPKIRNG